MRDVRYEATLQSPSLASEARRAFAEDALAKETGEPDASRACVANLCSIASVNSKMAPANMVTMVVNAALMTVHVEFAMTSKHS